MLDSVSLPLSKPIQLGSWHIAWILAPLLHASLFLKTSSEGADPIHSWNWSPAGRSTTGYMELFTNMTELDKHSLLITSYSTVHHKITLASSTGQFLNSLCPVFGNLELLTAWLSLHPTGTPVYFPFSSLFPPLAWLPLILRWGGGEPFSPTSHLSPCLFAEEQWPLSLATGWHSKVVFSLQNTFVSRTSIIYIGGFAFVENVF